MNVLKSDTAKATTAIHKAQVDLFEWDVYLYIYCKIIRYFLNGEK